MLTVFWLENLLFRR